MKTARSMIVVHWHGGRAATTFGSWASRDRAQQQADRWRRVIEAKWPDMATRPVVFVQTFLPESAFTHLLDFEIRFQREHPGADEQVREEVFAADDEETRENV